MSASNGDGVIRIGRKGVKNFAIGEDGETFAVDVVVAFQGWIGVDEAARQKDGPEEGTILTQDMPAYHESAVAFVRSLSDKVPEALTTAEALDFLARLREQYNELVDFFRPKRKDEDDSPATSGAELQFSAEPSAVAKSA